MESENHIRKSGIMAMTFDDVMTYDSYDLYMYLLNRQAFYGKYLRLMKPITRKEAYARDKESIVEWLAKDGLTKPGESLVPQLGLMYSNLLMNYYSGNMLRSSVPTRFAKTSLTSAASAGGKEFTEIDILVKYRTDAELKSKKDFISRHFGVNKKIRVIPLKLDEKYSDIMTAKIPNWDIFVTDSVADVERLAAGSIGHKEFLLPKYGYDDAAYRLKVLILSKDASINYYTAEDL